DKTYTAHIIFEDGSEKTYPLPRILPQGYILTVTNTDPENLNIRVITNKPLQPDARFTLIAQTNGKVHIVAKNKLEAQAFTAKIPKKRFPTGILQLTLFSPENEPVAERLVFINHNDFLNIDVSSQKAVFEKREKVKLTLDVEDPDKHPA